MNSLFYLTFLLYITCAYGAVKYYPNATHPDHPGHCYFKGPPEVKLKEQTVERAPDACVRITCDKDFNLEWASCGIIGTQPNCTLLPGDLNEPYPNCCGKYIC